MNKKYEITTNNLKQYASSMRDCKVIHDGSIEMDSQNGSINFDFSSFANIVGCVIKGKRISGDGSIIVRSDETNLNTKIVSKVEHMIQVVLPKNTTKINILRQSRSFGKVLICGIIIEIDDGHAEPGVITQATEIELESMNWRSIMNHCDPYKNVRIVKNKLFASEGGSLKSSNIESIITEPPNAFVNNGEFIKFMIPCEILEIKLSSKDKVHSGPLYRNVEAPPIITTNPAIYSDATNVHQEHIERKKYKSADLILKASSNIMYNSLESGININSLNSVIGSLSNAGRSIIMGRGSSFCIPMSSIEPNFEYVIAVTARKINGNGKLEVGIVADNDVRDCSTLITSEKGSELFFKIKSGAPSTDYKIKIGRGPNSVGEILVERIQLIKGIKNNGINKAETFSHIILENQVGGIGSGYYNHSELNIQVAKNSKEFSIIIPEDYAPPVIFNTSGVIWPITLSSRMWIRKITPLFPNLKVSNKAITMFDFQKSNEQPDVVMCYINGLMACNRIWIEEWKEENALDEIKINILKQCRNIMTPSLLNAQEILAAIPEANVQRVGKLWPMIMAESIKYDYFLYFEKDPILTNALISNWDDKFGKLIVVGSQVKLPSFAEFVADTASFTHIFTLLMGAKGVIDLSNNNYYISGILKLATALSLPIITNNHSFLNQNNFIMIEQDLTSYSINKAINKFIVELPKTPAKFNGTYNNEIDITIRKLIGI